MTFSSKSIHPDAERIIEYQRILLHWWQTNARDYPWRRDRTPYRTAVAELMLRRTRADQVVPVFTRFLRSFSTLKAAAHAEPEELLELLRPLGLAWRAQSMLSFFRAAYERHGNDLPHERSVLIALPGIGEYVSNAVACFSGEQSVPLIDVNIVRVLGRIFGIRTDGEARRRSDMKQLASQCVPDAGPAEYHYAVLDFAAKVCVARKPRCTTCPFSSGMRCEYYRRLVQE